MSRIQTTGATKGKATGYGAGSLPARISGRRIDFSMFTSEHRKLCYDSSRWQAYLYAARQTATEKAEKEIATPLREDEGLKTAKASEVADMASAMGRELFSRLYADPAKREKPEAPAWMDRVHSVLDEMPEWDQLRKQVAGDPDFSALATQSMLHSLAPRLAELIKQVKKEEQEQGGEGSGDGSGGGSGAEGKDLISGQDKLRADLRAACAAASEAASDGKEALGGIAPGLDGTPPADMQKETERFELLQAVTKDPDFAEIARRAGRLKRISGRSEMRRSINAYEEVVDIELGGDIERLLPSEICKLMDPDLEILALSEIADRRAMQYRLEGHEPQGRGPIVYLRDISGSMSGDGHLWGAAIGVALSAQSWKERRPMISAIFNYYVHAPRRLDPTGFYELKWSKGTAPPEVSACVQSGKLAPAAAALAHARDGVSGGTDFGEPLRFAMAAGVQEPRADFIFCTDGQAEADPETLAKLEAAKGAGLRIFGLCVNGGSVSGPLRKFCDEVLDIDRKDYADEATLARKLGGMIRSMR